MPTFGIRRVDTVEDFMKLPAQYDPDFLRFERDKQRFAAELLLEIWHQHAMSGAFGSRITTQTLIAALQSMAGLNSHPTLPPNDTPKADPSDCQVVENKGTADNF
jgi:hypothetical protein